MTSRFLRSAALAGALLMMSTVPAIGTWDADTAAIPAMVGTATLEPVPDANAALSGSTVSGSWTPPHGEASYTLKRTIGTAAATPVTGITADGTFSDDVSMPGTPLPFASISAGGDHTCAIDDTGKAWCWGGGSNGQLGTGTPSNQTRPTPVDTTSRFATITTGGFRLYGTGHTCAIDTAGTAWCWGGGSNGQLGTGTTSNQTRPTPVDTTSTFRSIDAGTTHTCAIDTAGKAWCWGNGGNGRLGTGDASSQTRPTRVDSTASFTAIAAGDQHTCAIDTDGVAWCWGAGGDGQLGTGTTVWTTRPSPTQTDTTARFTTITASLYSTCALDTSQRALCWGMGNFGQLGNGSTRIGLGPTAVHSDEKFSAISAGMYSACAVAIGGETWCWGYNPLGGLGTGYPSDQTRPTRVASTAHTTSVAVGDEYTCGIDTSGAAWCTGRGVSGELGHGGTYSLWAPAGVAHPTSCPSQWEKVGTSRCRPGAGLPIRYSLDYAIRGWTPDRPASFTATR